MHPHKFTQARSESTIYDESGTVHILNTTMLFYVTFAEAPRYMYYTALALVMHVLYQTGSVLYLAVTGVLCWDVAFLSW